MARPALMWFRRDLRVLDHEALAAAVAEAGDVLAVFVEDPHLMRAAGPVRRDTLGRVLHSLDQDLGGALSIGRGDPIDVIPEIAGALDASTVYVTRDHGPIGRRRDQEVAERLRADGRELREVGSAYLVEPGTVRKADGDPYAVFTPFWKQWRPLALAAVETMPAEVDPARVSWIEMQSGSEQVVDRVDRTEEMPDVGSAAAHQRWEAFTHHDLDAYDESRNRPDRDATSGMSVHLKWGTVHPRTLLWSLREERGLDRGALESGSIAAFVRELAWREFYADVLFHRPDSAWSNLNSKFDALPVDTDAAARERFDRWRSGRTGCGLVDAGMRQLERTGWMHNRVRMVTASFLVKDLHLPWQWGARHFLDRLVDGDVASNNHGWQWVAGSGTDAAPYFRVFNPEAQRERFDPEDAYVSRWVPEWGTSSYPDPMVDHAAARVEALERYEMVRAGS